VKVLAVVALLAAGCLGFLEKPPPPTVTESGAMVFRTDASRIEAVQLPPEYEGMRFATVATGFPGAEPNIGVTAEGSVYVSAYERILRSRDGGRTWQVMHHMQLGQTFDPMLWVDRDAGRVFSTHIYPDKTCSTLIYSDNPDAAAPSWAELPLRCPSPVVDHQKLATGPLVGPLGVAGGILYPNLLTLCYNKLSATHCAVSLDGGMTYLHDGQVDANGGQPSLGGPRNCGGLNGHQTHALDGTIYVPYGFDCRRGRIAVSTDGGFTWTRRDLGVDQLELDPEVAVTTDGTAYYLYRGSDQAMHLLRSRDHFATWDGPFRASPPEVKGAVFAGLTAGSPGRIAFAYLGNTQSDAGPDDVPPGTAWNLYVGMSLDADAPAPTFVTQQVNPDGDPVQRGAICHTKACKEGNRNLLDFIDTSLGPDGRVWVSYTDGCTSPACLRGETPDSVVSRSEAASVAWLLEGPSLLGGRLSAI
jgi:hypothetical protein